MKVEMKKTSLTKEDGRKIIYYSFTDKSSMKQTESTDSKKSESAGNAKGKQDV